MMDGLSSAILPLFAVEEPPLGNGIFYYVGAVLVIMAVLIFWARSGLQGRVFKNPITQVAEQCYLFIEHMCTSVIGPQGRKYVTFVMTLWLFIVLSNLSGLILPHNPNLDWSITASLAIIVFVYVQYEGIRQNGVVGHLRHFAGPKMDNIVMILLMTPLIFAIEMLSEWMKILSLSIRLYGNIFAGHSAREALDHLVPSVPILGGAILPLEILVAIIQAFVFTLLTCIYLSLVTHDSEHDQEHGAEDDHIAPAHAAA
jgi:F-type H+-transporting ATPase subunit a